MTNSNPPDDVEAPQGGLADNTSPKAQSNQVVTLQEKAKMLVTAAVMLWSPLTKGELLDLLAYTLQNLDVVTDLLKDDSEAKNG